jgi:hypothetical protein
MSEPRHEEPHPPHEPPPVNGSDKTEEVVLPPVEDEDDRPPTAEDIAELAKHVTVEAEVIPPPRLALHRCHRGHEQLGACESTATSNATGEVIARSGPMCVRCHIDWMGAKFRTMRVTRSS